MNTYICLYKGRRIEVCAQTTFDAQCKAAELLRARKRYDVIVALAEKDGAPVIHKPEGLTP